MAEQILLSPQVIRRVIISNFFLLPSSNENNLIYLRSSEWGKRDKKQQIFSGVVLTFVL